MIFRGAIVTQAEAAFNEGFVEADGFHIRYLTAGEGPVLAGSG
jgi:hypothetical protein